MRSKNIFVRVTSFEGLNGAWLLFFYNLLFFLLRRAFSILEIFHTAIAYFRLRATQDVRTFSHYFTLSISIIFDIFLRIEGTHIRIGCTHSE
jgi:hypothetical protein